ncbi:hypothetical protein RGUI_0316 [Rhodovulum sp. P5]|nr:hypothetical protein RGUI_0316 [Rhodovulum sp. P5]
MRLGTGFADDGSEDALVEALLRTAISAIEGRTSKVLLSRSFTWVVSAWRGLERQELPVAPVSSISALRLVDPVSGNNEIAPERYRLERDAHAPCLFWRGGFLPSLPVGGSAEIDFDAGFGSAWASVPEDLGHAVFLLAAHYYEHRAESSAAETGIPFGVSALADRWRHIRIGGGQR